MTTQNLDELSELVACTLIDTDLKTQRERWINLGENFGLGRHRTRRLPSTPETARERNLRLAEVAHRIVEHQSLLEPKPKSPAL